MGSARHAQDYYSILGIDNNAGEEEIRAAYRAKALKLHPDLGGNAEGMTLLNNAYEVLSDPIARRAYDTGRIPDYAEQIPFTPRSSTSCSIEGRYQRQRIKRIWWLILGADCSLFLGLYFVLVTMDPEVARSFVQSLLARVASVLFLTSAAVFLYCYHKTSRAESKRLPQSHTSTDSPE